MTQSIVETANSTERAQPVRDRVPAVDVYENDREVLVLADLPGVTAQQLEVKLDHPDLSIEGRAPGPDGTWTRYRRQFRVGSSVDAARIEAELDSGVLRVHLPKPESHQARKIKVRAS